MKRRANTHEAHEYWGQIAAGQRRMDDQDLQLLRVIRKALADGIHYTSDMTAYVAREYGIPLSEFQSAPETRIKVEGGELGMEIYYARCELNRIDELASDVTAAQGIKPGDVFKQVGLGWHTFSTVVVTSVADGGVTFTAKKRGSPRTWSGTTGASHLQAA